MSGIRIQSSPVVSVTVTSSVTSLAQQSRFNRDLSIGALKGKLELMTGASATDMVLEVFTSDDKPVCTLSNNDSMLGSYPVDDGMRLHVIDKRGKTLEFEDVSTVQKYEISDEDYAKRGDSVRAFKQKMKVGQFQEVDPHDKERKETEKKQKEDEETALAASMKPGDRCEVKITGQPTKRGTVRYVGTTDFKPGHWVGVEYDEPLGKNDGSVEGKRYFECRPKYGAFIKPAQVTVGDFPEIDDMDEL